MSDGDQPEWRRVGYPERGAVVRHSHGPGTNHEHIAGSLAHGHHHRAERSADGPITGYVDEFYLTAPEDKIDAANERLEAEVGLWHRDEGKAPETLSAYLGMDEAEMDAWVEDPGHVPGRLL